MKRFLAAALPLVVLITTPAAAANGEFLGPFNVKVISPGCNGSPNIGGGRLMRYFPPGVGGNGAATDITLRDWYVQGETQNFHLGNGTLIGTAFVPVTYTEVGRSGSTGTAKVVINSQSPATIGDATKVVKIAGRILGFGGNADCTVVFDATVYGY